MKPRLDLHKKTVLFMNKGGAHTYLAMRLAEDVKRVMVYTPNKDSLYPHPRFDYIGHGLPGLEVVHSFVEAKKEVYAEGENGLFVFPFTGDGDLQAELRADGRRVFGSGAVEKLEMNRPLFKKTLQERGLPTAPDEIFVGIERLRKLAREDPGWWIKYFSGHSTCRGAGETFFLDEYAKSSNELNRRALSLGCLAEIWEFMGEKPLKGFETGNDRHFSGGNALSIGTWGYELKNLAYICRCMEVDKFPRLIRQVNDAMAPVWKKANLCGSLSDETRIVKGRPYCVDLTPREGSPPGEIRSRLYKNITEMIWCCAGGEEVTPEPIAKYAACVNIKCPDAAHMDVPLEIKDRDMDKVLLKSACKIKGQVYNICGPPDDCDDEVATAIGFGDILEEAQQQCLENAEKIDAPGLWYPADCFDETEEVLEKAEKAGLEKL
jgi:hypothetical protein